jgi:hypothetical protein
LEYAESMPEKKLRFKQIEAPIADHCNLRCKSCSHHSPYLAPHFYDLGRFSKDVQALSNVCELDDLLLIGGEPLINPHIDDYLAAARDSGVAKNYGVVTNGILLHRMTNRFFELVDFILVSAYPATSPSRKAVDELMLARAHQFSFKYNVNNMDSFYNIETPKLSESEAQRSFDGCRRRVHMPLIHSGFFYKCMRPPTTREYLESHKMCEEVPDFASIDGVSLDTENLLSALKDYMHDSGALQSCSFCQLGIRDSYMNTPYHRARRMVRRIPLLGDMVSANSFMMKLERSFDSKISPPESAIENPVPVHQHEMMDRRECEPR